MWYKYWAVFVISPEEASSYHGPPFPGLHILRICLDLVKKRDLTSYSAWDNMREKMADKQHHSVALEVECTSQMGYDIFLRAHNKIAAQIAQCLDASGPQVYSLPGWSIPSGSEWPEACVSRVNQISTPLMSGVSDLSSTQAARKTSFHDWVPVEKPEDGWSIPSDGNWLEAYVSSVDQVNSPFIPAAFDLSVAQAAGKPIFHDWIPVEKPDYPEISTYKLGGDWDDLEDLISPSAPGSPCSDSDETQSPQSVFRMTTSVLGGASFFSRGRHVDFGD